MRRRLTGGGGVHRGFLGVPNRGMGGEGGGGVGSVFFLSKSSSLCIYIFHFWGYRGVWKVFLFLMKDYFSKNNN